MTDNVAPQRGEIWYAFLPGQPDDPHQPRPGLVISENVRNRMSDDLIVVPIFSVLDGESGRSGPTRVPLHRGMGGIRHDSILYCEELCTIDRDFLVEGPLGGRVPPSVLDRVVRAIFVAVGSR